MPEQPFAVTWPTWPKYTCRYGTRQTFDTYVLFLSTHGFYDRQIFEQMLLSVDKLLRLQIDPRYTPLQVGGEGQGWRPSTECAGI